MRALGILLFFVLLSPHFASGQEFEAAEKVKSDILFFVDSLKTNGIDTIFTYQRNAIGYDLCIPLMLTSDPGC